MKRIVFSLLFITSLSKACYFPIPKAEECREVRFDHAKQRYCLKIPLDKNKNTLPTLYVMHGNKENRVKASLHQNADYFIVSLNNEAMDIIKCDKSSPHHLWWNGSLIIRSRL